MAAQRDFSPKRHRRRDHVPRHRRVEPGYAARAAVLGTAGAVAVGAAFGLSNAADQPPPVDTAAMDTAFHERVDQAASRGSVGRAPVAGVGAHARAVPVRARAAVPVVQSAPPPVEVPEGCHEYSGNRQIGCSLLSEFGFGLDQMPALERLWTHESGWNHQAWNASSGAYGIPQALPGNKMAAAGADWETNPATQIRWGLGYIKNRYGNPDGAYAFFQANGWY